MLLLLHNYLILNSPREYISQAPDFDLEHTYSRIDYSQIYKFLHGIEREVLHILEFDRGFGAGLDNPYKVLVVSTSHQPGKRTLSATPLGRVLARHH